MPRHRLLAIVLGCLAALAVLVFLALVLLAPRLTPVAEPEPNLPHAVAVPTVPPSNIGGYNVATLADPAWVARVAEATGIPPRVLAAYGGAAIAMEGEHPYCNLGWNTLAGVGQIESHHGTANGSSIGADGNTTVPIIGPELKGEGFSPQADSDQGALDGDTAGDRAVGPMQFLPSTWAVYASDGNADGVMNPQNIDDAVMAAARYLCQAGDGDQHDPVIWRDAIAGYNASDVYIADVADAANRYAAAVASPRLK